MVIVLLFLTAEARAQQLAYKRARLPGRTLLLAAPVYVGEEYGARLEYNLGGGTIAIEGVKVARGEEFSETQVKEEGLSLVTEGFEGTLYVSRFSKPWLMGGFYWSMAIGYRQLTARWRRPTPESYALATNEDVLTHKMVASGYTGHARLGYRYVSERMPVFLGAMFGMRHFENKFEDVSESGTTPTTEDDRRGLSRMLMTRPEIGVELGLIF